MSLDKCPRVRSAERARFARRFTGRREPVSSIQERRSLSPRFGAKRFANVGVSCQLVGTEKTERRNFRVRSRGWGTQARPSPRGRTVIRDRRGVNLFRKSRIAGRPAERTAAGEYVYGLAKQVVSYVSAGSPPNEPRALKLRSRGFLSPGDYARGRWGRLKEKERSLYRLVPSVRLLFRPTLFAPRSLRLSFSVIRATIAGVSLFCHGQLVCLRCYRAWWRKDSIG